MALVQCFYWNTSILIISFLNPIFLGCILISSIKEGSPTPTQPKQYYHLHFHRPHYYHYHHHYHFSKKILVLYCGKNLFSIHYMHNRWKGECVHACVHACLCMCAHMCMSRVWMFHFFMNICLPEGSYIGIYICVWVYLYV